MQNRWHLFKKKSKYIEKQREKKTDEFSFDSGYAKI